MITNIQTFEVNSYYCTKNGDSSDINYYLDVDQHFLDNATHFSITSAYVPNTFTQLDHSDSLILTEGNVSQTYTYSLGTYLTKQNMMTHLQQILNGLSTNNFSYTISDNNILLDDKAIKITCSDTTVTKTITLKGKYLTCIYGLQNTNTFTNTLIGFPTNLFPIAAVYIHANICDGYNSSGLGTADIICSVNYHNCGTEQTYGIRENMRPFSPNKNIRFYLTDFDNYPLDLFNNDWKITISFFSYREEYISKINQFIDYASAIMGNLI